MKHRAIFLLLCSMFAVVFLAGGASAQPSAAQVKKDVSGPKTISVTVNGRGSKVWSKGYSKYVWDVPFSAKVKSEEPGVNILVEATASYDIVGGRYVYWKSFVAENTYEGIPNPTPAEANALIQKFGAQKVMQGSFYDMVGQPEVMRIAATPKFMWHNLNSVSFSVECTYMYKKTYTETERVTRTFRVRLYRNNKTSEWHNLLQVADETEG